MLLTASTTKKKVVYLIRHAEAFHNIKEREAVERAKAAQADKAAQEVARRAVLDDEALKDAPLSADGRSQAAQGSNQLSLLNKVGFTRYPAPKLVLVSPLRRALMTATELFLCCHPRPKFVAMEALREKRTGFAADERSSVSQLEKEFPHVDFSDLRQQREEVPKGEDNPAVRARGKAFLEGPFSTVEEDSVAIVTHKGWLREMRKTFKSWIDEGTLSVDFDMDHWDQTLYKNAEIRVNSFGWDKNQKLSCIVSKSVESAIATVVEDAVKHLIEKSTKSLSDEDEMLSHDDSDSDDDYSDSDDDDSDYEDDILQEEEKEKEGDLAASPPQAKKIVSSTDLEHPSPTDVTKHIVFG